MVKDVRLYVEEAQELGVSMEVAKAVAGLWEMVKRELGSDSDFTAAIKPIEQAAGVVVVAVLSKSFGCSESRETAQAKH